MPMKLETWSAPPGEQIPNHPSFPVLVYRGVPRVREGADACRALFAEHGWRGAWVDGVFDYHHFHSTSHEVLGVIGGGAARGHRGPQGGGIEGGGGGAGGPPPRARHPRAAGRGGVAVGGGGP